VFSSGRRHTTSTRDWSSDVCSSVLELVGLLPGESALSRQFLEAIPLLGAEGNKRVYIHTGYPAIYERTCRAEEPGRACLPPPPGRGHPGADIRNRSGDHRRGGRPQDSTGEPRPTDRRGHDRPVLERRRSDG